ncbi:MAG: Gfo/Idh/MocA family protein [Candidatus Sumerlaeaceae bacterium]
MEKVRVGVVGLGYMGMQHAHMLADGSVKRAELVALSSSDPAKRAQFLDVRGYDTCQEMVSSGDIDAIVIATPHMSHVDLGICALQAGLHTMVEKPLASSKGEAERLLLAREESRQVFAIMFNLRTRPILQKVREIVISGELGEVRRVNWTATMFFRPEVYYARSAWRGTWAGEGGGVLLNQAPHHLDLLQWIVGMPALVRGFCKLGRYHNIEVEDDATAYLEWPNGATGTFTVSTGEAPGTTRIEIAGEMGRLVYENDRISFLKIAQPMSEFGRVHPDPMGKPAIEDVAVSAELHGGNYVEMLQNFVDAILDGTALIAPAEDGLKSLELANAILLSSLLEKPVTMPINAPQYDAEIQKLMRNAVP